MPWVSIHDVPFPALRYSDQACYVRAGYGGTPMEAWPICRFFDKAARGDRDAAMAEFAAWYTDQFRRFAHVPKRNGGMRDGSLYRLVERRHVEAGLSFDGDAEAADPGILAGACRERAAQRLALLDAIAANGYSPGTGSRILGVRRDDLVYLYEGHHRAAALRALGYEAVPDVHVFTSARLLQLASATVAGGRRVATFLRDRRT